MLVLSDAATTLLMVHGARGGYFEANALAARGQAQVGMVAYCVASSALVLVGVLPALLGRSSRSWGEVTIKLVAYGAVVMKLLVVANNVILWGDLGSWHL